MGLRLRPFTRKFGYYLTAILIIYWLFIRQIRIHETFEVTVDKIDPKSLWEYWADFSNYKKINPTILDFEIDYEHGTYDNWEYGVTYTERLIQIPLTVTIKAKFIVTPLQKKGHFSQPYRIVSEHVSCMWMFCLHTDADMTFSPVDNGDATKIMESVYFGSPYLMKWFNIREFRAQRQEIAKQLREIDFNQ